MKRILSMVTGLLLLATIVFGTISVLEWAGEKQLQDELVQHTQGNLVMAEEKLERLQAMDEEQSYFILYTLISLVLTVVGVVVGRFLKP